MLSCGKFLAELVGVIALVAEEALRESQDLTLLRLP